ncbi:MAG TPA: hypothetical protein VM619_01060 [Luteimonas sp.]|nr:hypothetical protein [Luteimonas sp.]
MNVVFRSILPGLAMLLASGCMTTYKMAPGTPAAKIEIMKGATAWICADTPPQLLVRDRQGEAAIPADRRVTVGVNFVSSDGYMNYSCSPSVSFTPVAGAAYYQDFETENEACTALVYRKTADARVGLAFEETMDRGGPGCTR